MNTTETNYLEATRINRQAELIAMLDRVIASDADEKTKARQAELIKRELGMIWS